MQDQNYLMCFDFEVNGVFFGCHDKCPVNEVTRDGAGTHSPQPRVVLALCPAEVCGTQGMWPVLPDADLQTGLWGQNNGFPVSTSEEEQDSECRVSAQGSGAQL